MPNDPILAAESLPQHAAFRVLLLAAQRGDHRAFVNLGYAYDVGRGVRKSKAKALRWYRRALERGDASAANNIATIYRDRGYVLTALRYFRRAVALGSAGSSVEMGKLLLGPLASPSDALVCFRSVAHSAACEADIERATALAAATETFLASGSPGA